MEKIVGAFKQSLKEVEIDLGMDAEDLDHLISPGERLRVAMAMQEPTPGRQPLPGCRSLVLTKPKTSKETNYAKR